MAGFVFASCTSDDLLQDNTLATKKAEIGFNMKTNNATRGTATQAMAKTSHYEFGVFADKGTTLSGSNVMTNYLVAYATTDNAYSDYANSSICTTWGATSGNSTTVDADGISSWVYESLGNDDYDYVKLKKPMTKSYQAQQVLKYWDMDQENTFFFAYTPYQAEGANIEYTAGSDNTADFKYTSLSSFYTYPARKDYQVGTAITAGKQVATKGFKEAENFATDRTNDAETAKANNAEIVNANEALYAATPVAKTNYEKDVALTFKHINAKINIAFYEEVKGYSVELMDMVPEDITTKGTVHAAATVDGIAFTPATKAQATTPLTATQPAKADLPHYYADADVTVSGIKDFSTAATIAVAQTAADADGGVNTNLYFDIVNGGKDQQNKSCIATTKAYATSSTYVMPTTYYALPNYANGDYIDGDLSKETGYTLHVSYILHPADGSADTKVYDARVWVPAEKCQWEAGKAYTYIFKITDKTNGTTDPNKVDPADNGEPYIDPDDPRVPDDPALTPIVFDGVEVADYEEAHTGQTDPDVDTWEISDPKLTTALTNAVTASNFTYTYGGEFLQSQNKLTLNTTTGDFKVNTTLYPDEPNAENANNFFQNIKKFFDQLNTADVEYIYYNKNYYKWNDTEKAWKNIGATKEGTTENGSIESNLATDLYTADLAANGGTVSANFTLVGAESTLLVKFTANIKNFLVAALTSAKPNPLNSNGYIEVNEKATPYPIVTLYATANDVKWTGWPSKEAPVNTNGNNFYKDLTAYLTGLAEKGVERIDYNSQDYNLTGTNFVGSNSGAKLQDQLAYDGYAALINTANKGKASFRLYLYGTLYTAQDTQKFVDLSTEITDWDNDVFDEHMYY